MIEYMHVATLGSNFVMQIPIAQIDDSSDERKQMCADLYRRDGWNDWYSEVDHLDD